jgi:DNA-directed RNA polymerase subunit beta'
MRTFHTGGVAGGDITNGLPRVEELFEARKPKGLAQVCEADGVVQSISHTQDNRTEVIVKGEEETSYIVPFNATLKVSEGDFVEAGDNITQGPLYPHDLLRLKGVEGVYQYLIKEVQKVYKDQGVDINDKHIEIIVSQMLSKRKIEDAGDTDLLPGGLYSVFEIQDANEKAEEEGGEPATSKVTLLGITISTNSESSMNSELPFLSGLAKSLAKLILHHAAKSVM